MRRLHGVRGELSVEVLTEFPERLCPGRPLRWRRARRALDLRIRSSRAHGKRLLLAFEGIEKVEEARELVGGELAVDSDRVPPSSDAFLYGHEIEGWSCEDTRGARVGRARDLERTAGGPMLSIETGRGEALVPFVWPIVVLVDREARRIVLDPPEGLLEL